MNPMIYSGAWGETDSWKKPESQKSQTLFKFCNEDFNNHGTTKKTRLFLLPWALAPLKLISIEPLSATQRENRL
jgi:hypothetical protein